MIAADGGLIDIQMIESYLDVIEVTTQVINAYRELNDKRFLSIADIEDSIGVQVDKLLMQE